MNKLYLTFGQIHHLWLQNKTKNSLARQNLLDSGALRVCAWLLLEVILLSH